MLETPLTVLNPPLMAHSFIKSRYASNLCPEKFQKHGDNQQEKEYNKKFIEWFIGFVEGDGCFYITRGKPVFSIHLHIIDLPLLYEIQSSLQKVGTILIKTVRNTYD
jgi:LAGLIDADG endonuclease